ncbi:hypothetical protein GJ496_005654 [Pomphorhynchus laevis]|nr:hypothetical protein GJ496_005654 [Pomphorhynchus laevis]
MDPSDLQIPVRRSMFALKRPVTLLKNHINEDPPADDKLNSGKGIVPSQMLWEKRLDFVLRLLRPDSSSLQKEKTTPLADKLVGHSLSTDEINGIYLSLISSLHQNWQHHAIVGQFNENYDMLDRNQPLMKCLIVSDNDIAQQEDVVRKLRENLAAQLEIMENMKIQNDSDIGH